MWLSGLFYFVPYLFVSDMVFECDSKDLSEASEFCSLYSLSWSAVSVHDSHAYRNMEMTRARISFIFDLSVMFLSFQIVFSLFIAADVCAILDMISGFDPSSDTTALRYLNLLTVSSFSPLL